MHKTIFMLLLFFQLLLFSSEIYALEDLAPEEILTIINYLSYKDISSLILVNKYFYEFVESVPEKTKFLKYFQSLHTLKKPITYIDKNNWKEIIRFLWRLGKHNEYYFQSQNSQIIKNYIKQSISPDEKTNSYFIRKKKLKKNFSEQYYPIINLIKDKKLYIYSDNTFDSENSDMKHSYHYFKNIHHFNDDKNSPVYYRNFPANSFDSQGYTPLHSAVYYGDTEYVLYLLNQGADCNLQRDRGDTPCMIACIWGYVDIAKILFPLTNLDIKDRYGETIKNNINACTDEAIKKKLKTLYEEYKRQDNS